MEEKIFEAKTIEAAAAQAEKELRCRREELNITILQEPAKGIFGLARLARIRASLVRPATADSSEPRNEAHGEGGPGEEDIANDVSEEAEYSQTRFLGDRREDSRHLTPAFNSGEDTGTNKYSTGQVILEKILSLMDIRRVRVSTASDSETIILNVDCDAEGLLIGRHGKTREAMQYLVNRIAAGTEDVHKERHKYILDIGGYLQRHRETLQKIAHKTAQRVKETKAEEKLQAMSAFDRRIIHLALKDDPEVHTYSIGESTLRQVVIAPKQTSS